MPDCAYRNAMCIKNGNYSLLSCLHVHHEIDFCDFLFLCVIIAAAGFCCFFKMELICKTVKLQASLYNVCVCSTYHPIPFCVEL